MSCDFGKVGQIGIIVVRLLQKWLNAPVAQRIEHLPSKEEMEVRFPPGVQILFQLLINSISYRKSEVQIQLRIDILFHVTHL